MLNVTQKQKICLRCNTCFTPNGNNQKFCNSKCNEHAKHLDRINNFGHYEISNVQFLCSSCHMKKHRREDNEK